MLKPWIARSLISFISLIVLVFLVLNAETFWGKGAVFLVLGGVIVKSLQEYYHITTLKGYHPAVHAGISVSLVYLLAIFLFVHLAWSLTFVYFVLFIGFLLLFAAYLFSGHKPLGNIAISLFPLLYITIPLSFLFLILYLPLSLGNGQIWLLFLFAVTISTDIGAYLFGKCFGRHQMAPYVSPHKTWEGAFGGFMIGLIASFLFYIVEIPFFSPTLLQILFLGATLSILGQFGDLAESLLKRDVGVKDSANIPGVGGVLDVIDSLVFTSPFLYLMLRG